METNKTSFDDKIALIHSDLQKIVKHFKLDRRSKNNPEDSAETDIADEENEKLLREILDRIGEIEKTAGRKEFTTEQIAALKRVETNVDKVLRDFHNAEYREIKTSLERTWKALDDMKGEKQDSEIHHRHSIDLSSSKVFLSIIVMGLIILGLSYVIGNQRQTLSQFRDNDLKYRYVKMQEGVTAGEIKTLETIFTYNRNPDSIRLIHRQVVQYERLVKEQAEKTEQARLNATEAERLQQEAATVKGNK